MTAEFFLAGLFLSQCPHGASRVEEIQYIKCFQNFCLESRELKGQGCVRLGRGARKRGNRRPRGAKLHFPGSHGLGLQHPSCLCSCSRTGPWIHFSKERGESLGTSVGTAATALYPPQSLEPHRFSFRFLRQEDTNRCLAGPVSLVTSPNHVTRSPAAGDCYPDNCRARQTFRQSAEFGGEGR